MNTQELIQFIKTQLQNGQTKEAITANLISQGWQPPDIESAFNSLSSPPTLISNSTIITPPNTTPNITPTAKHFPFMIVIILITFLSLVGTSIFVLTQVQKNQPASEQNTITNYNPPPLSPTSQPPSEEIVTYSNPEQGFSFQHLQSWQISTQGTAVKLVSPENQNSPDQTITLFGDTLVSTIPYSGPIGTPVPGVTVVDQPTSKPREKQIKDLATQMAINNTITPITLNGLTGYEAPSTVSEGSTYNVILQGSKNMLLIQFPNKKSKSELNEGQLMILNTIVEL